MKTSQWSVRKILLKGLVGIMALALFLQPFLIFGSANSQESYSAEIMKVKGGRDAIATFTFDDGFYANDLAVAQLFEGYGMPASLMVVPSRVLGTPPYNVGYSTALELNELIKTGYIDVQNHSYSHLYMAPVGHVDYTEGNNTEANRYKEIVESKNFLATNFPSVDPIVFAVPGGFYDEPSMDLVMKTYYASRAKSGIETGTYQALNPTDDASAGGWYGIRTKWLSNDTADVLSYLDTCVNNGGWFLAGAHNIVNTGHYDITEDNLKIILDEAKAYSDEGKLWVASFSEAVKYLREVENSTVKQYENDFGLYVEVTMADKTEGGLPLSADIFDMPLTVKVEVPESFTTVRFSQKGVHTTAETFTEGSKRYAYLEIVPNSGAVLITSADSTLTLKTTNATLTAAKDGARAIATLTFDDGLVQTASKLNELAAEYGVKASLMIPSNNSRLTGNLDFWQKLVAEGNLSVEGHGRNHDYIGSNTSYDGWQDGNDSPENINDELFGSLADYRNYFPDQDSLAYTVPSAVYIAEAYKVLYQSYYAALGAECVLVENSAKGKMQSLDPAVGDPLTGAYKAGSWYQVYYARFQPEVPRNNPAVYPEITMENILKYLDTCVEGGGWFITSAHGMYENGYIDYTEDDVRAVMSRIKEYQDEGLLWSATFSEATKYIRERQNSEITVTTYGDGIYYANLTMADKTAEGLPLSVLVDMPDGTQRQIFNMPLTVKAEVPMGWREVAYSQAGGDVQYADTFTEGGKTYAYINLVPNGGEATFTSSYGGSLEGVVPEAPAGTYTQPEGTFVPTDTAVTYAVWANEDAFLLGAAPEKQFTSTRLLNEDIAGWGYVHVYNNLTSSDKIYPTVDLVINLGGKSITTPTGNKIENSLTLTVKNGTWYNGTQVDIETGQIQIRANCSLIVENVHFINARQWVGYGSKGDMFCFKDSKVEINGQNSYFSLVSSDYSLDVSELKFINTDIVIGGTVHPELGLFCIEEQNYGTSKWKITLDKNSTLRGKVDNWISCTETSVPETGKDNVYQRFSVQQLLYIEEGFTCSSDAKPTFTYVKTTLNSDNTTTTKNTSAPACDEILKMAVVYPGTEYELVGEVSYLECGDMYSIKVENGVVDKPVGSYIAPEGAWTPVDKSIVYAIFASEKDYLEGNEPEGKYTSSVLDTVLMKNGGYVVAFGDVSTTAEASGKVLSGGGAKLTLNLGGHTLTANYGFGTDYGSLGLTVCNGRIINKQQINFKEGHILFDNTYIEQNYYAIGWGCVFNSWTFRDSVLEINPCTATTNKSFFFIGSNPLPSDAEVRFENTDIKVNAELDERYGLICIVNEYYKRSNFTIVFDKDSSLVGNVPCLVSCIGADGGFKGAQRVIIEKGFSAGADAIPSFKYIRASSFDYTDGASLLDANDAICNMFAAAPGESVATEEEYSFVKNGELYVLTFAPDEPDEPDEPNVWKPAADTTYAIWQSAGEFLLGNAPLGEYTGNLDAQNILSVGSSYVQVYSDISLASQLLIITGDKVVIDLGGHTLNNSVGIEIYNGTELTIQNGSYNQMSGAQAYYRPASKMTYRNLAINVTYYHTLTYGYGCTELTYEGCTVTLNGANNYFLLGSNEGGLSCTLNIKNTDFIVNTALNECLFTVSESGYNRFDCAWTVNIDGESSVAGTGTAPGLIGLREGYAYNDGHYYGQFVNTQVFNIEEGFELSKSMFKAPCVYTFFEIDYDASVASKSAQYKEAIELLANDNACKIYLGGVLVNDATLYANPSADGASYSYSYSMDSENMLWYVKKSDGIYVGRRASKDDGGNALFTSADLNSLSQGDVVFFAQNAITGDDVTGNAVTRTDLTFDLSGNTLTIGKDRINLSSIYINNSYHRLNYTFKNGTIDCTIDQPFYGWGGEDSVFTFDGIVLNFPIKNKMLLDMYTGTFVIKNSTVNAPDSTVVQFEKGDNFHTVVIENSTINAKIGIYMYLTASMKLDYDDIYIKNSTFNCSDAVIMVEDNGSSANTFMNVDISDSFLNAPTVLGTANSAISGKVDVRLSNTYVRGAQWLSVVGASAENTECYSVSIKSGEKKNEVVGMDGYSCFVGRVAPKDGDFTANLTLFTSFNLNFFANPESISGVYYNGELLSAIDYEGRVKYTLYGIAPNTAAESLELTVGVIKDGVTYKVPISYSVLAYAKQVVEGEYSTLAKQLALSAVKYIQSAYVYCGKAAPEFDAGGVVITESDTTGESVESLTAAVDSIQLNLKESPYIRFNLKAGYTGTLKINDASFEIENGSFGEFTYVEIAVRAKDLTRDFTVEADGKCVSYNLKNYRNSEAVKADESLKALIDALYTYGEYAKEYSVNNPNLD